MYVGICMYVLMCICTVCTYVCGVKRRYVVKVGGGLGVIEYGYPYGYLVDLDKNKLAPWLIAATCIALVSQ